MEFFFERGYPARSERLPLTFDGVTPQWLTGVLQPRYPGAEVRAMEMTGQVFGHTSKARYTLDLNAAARAAGIPEHVCLKANWTGDPLSSDVCVNEARFYGLLSSRLDLPAPSCYFADWDDDGAGKQGFVMLEDLVERGGIFGTSGQPITLDDMFAAIGQLAHLHGSTWGRSDLLDPPWLQTALSPQTPTDAYWALMKDYVPIHNARESHLALLPNWAAQNPERIYQAFLQLRAEEMADPSPLCLVHGDAHLGNSYLCPDGHRIWLDWQIVRKGRPWRDVHYFMVGSLTIDQRREAERDLIRHYCERIARYGVTLDVDKAWHDYHRWLIWGIIAWHTNINPNENTLVSLERFCVAAKDHDLGAIYGF